MTFVVLLAVIQKHDRKLMTQSKHTVLYYVWKQKDTFNISSQLTAFSWFNHPVTNHIKHLFPRVETVTSHDLFENSASAKNGSLSAVSGMLHILNKRKKNVLMCLFLSLSDVCGGMDQFTFIHTLTSWIPETRPIK